MIFTYFVDNAKELKRCWQLFPVPVNLKPEKPVLCTAASIELCKSLPFVAKRELHFQLVLWGLFWNTNMKNKHFHHSMKALKSGLSTQFLIETGPKKVHTI